MPRNDHKEYIEFMLAKFDLSGVPYYARPEMEEFQSTALIIASVTMPNRFIMYSMERLLEARSVCLLGLQKRAEDRAESRIERRKRENRVAPAPKDGTPIGRGGKLPL